MTIGCGQLNKDKSRGRMSEEDKINSLRCFASEMIIKIANSPSDEAVEHLKLLKILVDDNIEKLEAR